MFGAQAELEAQLIALQRDVGTAGLVAECSSQLSALYALQKSISTASPATLAALRAEVATSITAAAATAQQARAGAAGAGTISAELGAVSAGTRSEVQALSKELFERRIFDKDLVFASPEDEAAYRRREAETRHYVEQQQARKTPEGELNAAGAVAGHMLDMETHGAARDPEFVAKRDHLIETSHKLRDALRHEGRSTEEYDRKQTVNARSFLKAKGLSDAQIEACLAKSSDPLEALKPYLTADKDVRDMDQSMHRVTVILERPTAVTTVKPLKETVGDQAAQTPELGDIMAKLRASGVATVAHEFNEPATHGVTVREHSASPAKSSITL